MDARNVKRFWSRQDRKQRGRNGRCLGSSAGAGGCRQRSLLAETLEQRDLLAGDLFSPPVAMGPVDGAAQFCVATCDPSGDQVTAQEQQRSAAGNQGPVAGRGATPMARARAAAQLRDRVRLTTPDDCPIADGNEPVQQRDRLQQDQLDDARLRSQDRLTQADRQVGERRSASDRDRLADCDNSATPLAERIGSGQSGRGNRGSGPVGNPIGQRPDGLVVTGNLTDDQVDGVLQMREEEKLAHDVYVTLGEKWDAAVFAQIAQAESQHMAAVGGVIERYGLDDPITDSEGNIDQVGVFPTEAVQELYNQLVTRGSQSIEDAYQVGATIEDLDIADLQDLQAAGDLPLDVARVYENLERGSRNHLRAFVSQIEATDGEYTAQYLTQDAVDAIVSTPIETGRPNRGGGRVDRVSRNGAAEQGRNTDAVRDRNGDAARDRDRVMDPAAACDQVFAEVGRLGTGRGPM